MKYILIIYFSIIIFSSNGQNTVCLNQDFNNEINDSIITFIRGNLISTNAIKNQEVIRNLNEKAKFKFTDCITKQEYVFIDSFDYPRGWLIIDKSRNRVNYIDQETIFVFNTLDRKCLIDRNKNCGFDIFLWSKAICGFSEPCYNFENGDISIINNKFFHRNIKLIIDTKTGVIKKQRK